MPRSTSLAEFYSVRPGLVLGVRVVLSEEMSNRQRCGQVCGGRNCLPVISSLWALSPQYVVSSFGTGPGREDFSCSWSEPGTILGV